MDGAEISPGSSQDLPVIVGFLGWLKYVNIFIYIIY